MIPSSLPDWVIIDRYVFTESFPTGEPTEASCTNSRGDEVRVCFQLREPPLPSRFYLCWPAGKGQLDRFFVVSAHRDAVLLQLIYPIPVHGRQFGADMYDYFLYTAGDGDGSRRPASMERLPSLDGTMADFRGLFKAGIFNYTYQRLRRLDALDIGVLRRGEDDSALAELQIDSFEAVQVEIHVLCHPSSSGRWQVRHPEIEFRDGELNLETLVSNWYSDIVMAAGSYLCWVDYCIGGILLCDVFHASSHQLHYILFPAKLPNLDRALHGGSVAEVYQSVCANEDHGVIKFFMIDQLDGQMIDERFTPDSGFRVTSWTLKITEANMSWVIDSMLKSDDLWKLDDFAQLPRIPLQYPVVSMANPNIVCFVLREEKGRTETGYKYDETWLVAIDMPAMNVMSLCQYINGKGRNLSPEDVEFIKFKHRYFEPFLPSELPKYLKLLSSQVSEAVWHKYSEHKQDQGDSDFDLAGLLVQKMKFDGA